MSTEVLQIEALDLGHNFGIEVASKLLYMGLEEDLLSDSAKTVALNEALKDHDDDPGLPKLLRLIDTNHYFGTAVNLVLEETFGEMRV